MLINYFQEWKKNKGVDNKYISKRTGILEGSLDRFESGSSVSCSTLDRLAIFLGYQRRTSKLVIFGSRDFSDYDFLRENVDRITRKLDRIVVLSGGARGADQLGERWAFQHGHSVMIFHPEYDRYKKQAPLVRNEQMAEEATHAIAFWDGVSRGTKHMIDCCNELKVKLMVISY